MIVLEGRKVAAGVKAQAGMIAAQLMAEEDIKPGLAVVLVGDDPASNTYVNAKIKDCVSCHIESFDYRLPATVGQGELNDLIDRLNNDDSVDGILVQLPLPVHLDTQAVISRISPDKDVDGFHPVNMGKLMRFEEGLQPCTPAGIMRLLSDYNIDVAGKRAVVIGRSNIVGKPLALLLTQADATVTLCHSKTPCLEEIVKEADIVVSAVGKPRYLNRSFIKPGVLVIDVGINRDESGSLCGDVDYEDVKDLVGAITPVPGGVGPMTRAQLMLNTVWACKSRHGIW